MINFIRDTHKDYEKAKRLLENFAVKTKKVKAIYEGHCPEEPSSKAYYLIIDPPYDFEMDDSISDLDMKIFKETGHECTLLQWPSPLEQVGNYEFIHKCIWRR